MVETEACDAVLLRALFRETELLMFMISETMNIRTKAPITDTNGNPDVEYFFRSTWEHSSYLKHVNMYS